MYSKRSGLVLGFHGCDKSIADNVISHKITLRKSSKPYDWLGGGSYFWENSLTRAIDFATELKDNPRDKTNIIQTPAAIGAVINLGFCLDLLDSANFPLLKEAHNMLVSTMGTALPKNSPGVRGGDDLLVRNLDCKVFESIHQLRRKNKLQPFDSIRGVFWEGDAIYEGAGFRDKNHIQICVINHNCIKGFFHPRENESGYLSV